MPSAVKNFLFYFNSPVEKGVIPCFRIFFATHIFLQSLKLPWNYGQTSLIHMVQGMVFLSALSMFHKSYYKVGLFFLVAYKFFWVHWTFPMTANHYFVEFFIVLFLLLFPDTEVEKNKSYEGASARLIQITILTIYFFGGVQKLIYGFWLNGEFIIHEFLQQPSVGLGKTLSTFLMSFDPNAILAPIKLAADMEVIPYHLSAFSIAMIMILSWLTLLTEIFVPLLFLFKKTRNLGLITMIILQVSIGFSSWETEFMFAALACMFLFFKNNPVRNYTILTSLHVLWSLFIIYVLDLRVGIL